MASNAEAAVPKTPRERYHIAPGFDLVIILKEFSPSTTRGEPDDLRRVHEFEVSKKILCEIDYFQVVGFSQSPADTRKDLYEVKDDDPAALKIWLELLHHGTSPVSMKVGIATVWRVLGVARKYKFHVLSASAQTWFRFDGLCLDCMMCSSKTKHNEDLHYWTRNAYDTRCRIKHGQPTWYFSSMGRKEKMASFQKKSRDQDYHD